MANLEQLYQGALLGSALSKSIGTGAAQGQDINTSLRVGELTAGVASGSINPSTLDEADKSLVTSGISNLTSVPKPSLGGALGFLKNLGGDVESFAIGLPQGLLHVAGEVPTDLSDVGQDAVRLFNPSTWTNPNKGLIVPPTVGDIESGVKSDVTQKIVPALEGHPQALYQHPLSPILDVAGALSGGAGLAVKGAGAISRAGAAAEAGDDASLAARTVGQAANASGIARTAQRVASLGSTLGRDAVDVTPALDAQKLQDLQNAGVNPAQISRAYSPFPVRKFAVQKPLDFTLGKLSRVKVPGAGGYSVGDLQSLYLGRKALASARGQIAAGTQEETLAAQKALNEATQKLYIYGQKFGQEQYEATLLHKMGINDLDKLDQYTEMIRQRADGDLEGLIPNEATEAAAEYRSEVMYQDPEFRALIANPTFAMREFAHEYDKMTARNLAQLPVSPQTHEENTFGRLQVLTAKTPEELKQELPEALRPNNDFAKGLFTLQQSLKGIGTADTVPTVAELASYLPRGVSFKALRALQDAVDSYRDDLEGIDPHDLLQDQDYVQGKDLFQKVTTVLHDRLGMDSEQAQAFSRGAPLGEADGPILPNYVPSISGQKDKFGLPERKLSDKPFRYLKRLGHPITYSHEISPRFYNIKRPFTPRSASAQTIGLGPASHYLEEPTYASFRAGAMRLDPEAIQRHVSQVSRDLVQRKLAEPMLNKLAFKDGEGRPYYFHNEGEMQAALGVGSSHYTFVPVGAIKHLFTEETEVGAKAALVLKETNGAVDDRVMGQIEDIADESAQRFVQDTIATVAQKGLALPTTFVTTLIKHAHVYENGTTVGRAYSFIIQRWRAAVLTYMPAWLLRTTVGHGILGVIDGVVNPKFWLQANDYFKDRPVLSAAKDDITWGQKYGDTMMNRQGIPYGVNQGGQHSELSDVGQGARAANLRASGQVIAHQVHTVTNYQRRAIFLRKLEKGANQRLGELGLAFEHPGGFWNAKNIDAVLDPAWRADVLKYPDLVEHAFDQLGQVSYTFGQMQPWERQLVKNIMPFYGWYKFISKFVWSLPLNYPGRAIAIAQIGFLGQAEHDKLGPMPSYLSGALFYDTHNLGAARYINLYGLNPLGDFANPFGPSGALGGVISAGQMSPIIQSLVAAAGYDPTTGGMEPFDPNSGIQLDQYGDLIDTKTGTELSNIGQYDPIQRGLGTFARSFPELKLAGVLADKGNPAYPEEIPVISPHPEAVNPATRKGIDALGVLGQETGIQPRTENLAKYQANLLKDVTEARKANLKAIAKAKQKLSIPNG